MFLFKKSIGFHWLRTYFQFLSTLKSEKFIEEKTRLYRIASTSTIVSAHQVSLQEQYTPPNRYDLICVHSTTNSFYKIYVLIQSHIFCITYLQNYKSNMYTFYCANSITIFFDKNSATVIKSIYSTLCKSNHNYSTCANHITTILRKTVQHQWHIWVIHVLAKSQFLCI